MTDCCCTGCSKNNFQRFFFLSISKVKRIVCVCVCVCVRACARVRAKTKEKMETEFYLNIVRNIIKILCVIFIQKNTKIF